SQPKTTSQKPKPPSAAEKNLSLCRYFPRSTPSMSDTATLTRLPGLARTASRTCFGAMFCGIVFLGYGSRSLVYCRFGSRHARRARAESIVTRRDLGSPMRADGAIGASEGAAGTVASVTDRSLTMTEESVEVHAAGGRASALASLHVAVLLFGLAGLFGKWIDLPAATIVLGRAAVAAAVLGILLRLGPAGRHTFEWRMAANGAVLAVHWFAFFKAIQIANVATGLLGFASFPLFVLLLEFALLRARARGLDWTIAGLVVVGLLILVPEPSLHNPVVQGLAWGVLSGFSFALLAVSNRALAARRAPTVIA